MLKAEFQSKYLNSLAVTAEKGQGAMSSFLFLEIPTVEQYEELQCRKQLIAV